MIIYDDYYHYYCHHYYYHHYYSVPLLQVAPFLPGPGEGSGIDTGTTGCLMHFPGWSKYSIPVSVHPSPGAHLAAALREIFRVQRLASVTHSKDLLYMIYTWYS